MEAPLLHLALVGTPNSGKTSLFNLVSGLRRPTAGTVHIGGTDITRLTPHRRARLGLGRTFQSSSVFGSLSVAGNVALAVQARRGGSMGLWRRPAAERAVALEAAEVLDRFLSPSYRLGAAPRPAADRR